MAVRKYKESIPVVAKSLEKRKREDDMGTDIDLSCHQTKTLRSFGFHITNTKNGQYFGNCTVTIIFEKHHFKKYS